MAGSAPWTGSEGPCGGSGEMFYVGKLLQLSGLVTASWAFVVGVWGDDMTGELTLLGVGAGVFLLGTFVLKRGQPS